MQKIALFLFKFIFYAFITGTQTIFCQKVLTQSCKNQKNDKERKFSIQEKLS
jgi:hypothetical protein